MKQQKLPITVNIQGIRRRAVRPGFSHLQPPGLETSARAMSWEHAGLEHEGKRSPSRGDENLMFWMFSVSRGCTFCHFQNGLLCVPEAWPPRTALTGLPCSLVSVGVGQWAKPAGDRIMRRGRSQEIDCSGSLLAGQWTWQ